jgi:hypothetical protein
VPFLRACLIGHVWTLFGNSCFSRCGRNLAKDQELRKDVQKDCDGNEFAYGCKRTSQKLAPMLAMESKGPKKGRQSHPGVLPAITKTQQDRDGWLQKKSDAARTGQPSEHIVKEVPSKRYKSPVWRSCGWRRVALQ